ncbi:MAG: 1-acyl-sn-glycerol-3-phosphate acyltransferase [Rhizobiaceae bacterium]
MTTPVSLPFWLAVLLVIFALVGLFDRIFRPSVRWFVRRRLNLAIDELNQKLDTRIQPFRLTERQAQVDRLMFDPKVLEAIEAEARATDTPRSVVLRRAEAYAREIVPSLSLFTYFGFGTRAAKWLSELIYNVRLGHAEDRALRAIDPDATVVFVINHRSNMDYVLVTYMASHRASLSYAVGEWARVWLLESVIRSMGAYFIRRNSDNELYRKVLSRYVAMATREGVTQAFFPEGGLTRDGLLNKPRLGLLGYMVGDFDTSKRDIVFVPVGLNYDRVLEDRILTAKAEHAATGRDFRVGPLSFIGFLNHMIWLRIRGRLRRFGAASVSFGEPVSLASWEREHGISFRKLDKDKLFASVELLAGDLMTAVGKIVPAMPVAVISHALLQHGDDWVSEPELKSTVLALMRQIEAAGGHVDMPEDEREVAVAEGLGLLSLRHMIEADALGRYRASRRERLLLRYYANSVAHLLRPGISADAVAISAPPP